jgi:hypothetical protein
MARNKTTKKIFSLFDGFSEEDILFYQTHPIDFIHDFIFGENSIRNGGHLFLSPEQEEVIMAIVVGEHDKTSVVTGKGFGKTGLIALVIIWFISVFPIPKIVATAPSFPQLRSALWPEVSKWLSESLVKEFFEITAERMYLIHPEYKDFWWAEPRSATKKENMQGLHAENMLLLIDEGSGVEDDIYEALDTTMTGSFNRLLTVGNGTKTDGFFFDSHHHDSKNWNTFQFSSIDSPFVDKKKTQILIEKYGMDHDVVRVSVLGKFPKGSPEAFIPLTQVEAAMQRDVKVSFSDEVHIGVDVARFGDDSTVLTWRHGFKVYEQLVYGKTSTDETVDYTLALVKQIRKQIEKKFGKPFTDKIKVKIDDTGVGGGVTDYLRKDRENNIEVIACNFGGTSTEDMYDKEASQMWGTVRDNIDQMSLVEDRFLMGELSSRKYKVPNGRIKIQPKDQFKKEYKGSPDRADSLVLCWFGKENERKLLNNFDMFDGSIVRERCEFMDSATKMSSVYYSKDMYVSMLVCAWDGYKLHFINEFAGDNNIHSIAGFLHHGNTQGSVFIGNDVMFGQPGQDLSAQFFKQGVRLQKNFGYDEAGAVQLFMQLIRDKRINISVNCDNLLKQMQNWNMYDKQSVLETEYGLCYAAINVASKLRDKISSPWSPPARTEYHHAREAKQGNGKLVNPAMYW